MRYVVGIDLGTTNSCISYIDTQKSQHAIHPFLIPQLKEPGFVDEQSTLPSFCYLASSHEWPPGSLDLPWKNNSSFFVGSFALSHGGKVPTRLVQSAKSWLCHPAANRRDKILPSEAVEDSIRISPVEASVRYLAHLRDAWNYKMASGDPEAELQQQEIILTVPASFDEVARSLTAEAARSAGFTRITLLEEPQAAFYAWISHHEKKWEQKIKENSTILVCDVGGGTTDFSLIEVVEKSGHLTFQRMAVGDHLLLGGDNMDAALSHFIESKARQQGHQECTPLQWMQLRHEARKAKEILLGSNHETYRVLLQGKGSGVIQGSYSVEINKIEVLHLLQEGFFGFKPWEEALQLRRGSAIRSMGLPYEEEPSILKHMASFLNSSKKEPDYILFNGGAMKPKTFQEAVTDALKQWFPKKELQVLDSASLDLSVSRGAAYYGKVRRGEGVRIGGGAARGYYLGVDVKGIEKAMTLLPRGSEEGATFEAEQTFWVSPNTPVSFKLYSSHVRLHDEAGSFLDIVPEEIHPLPPIQTLLRIGKGTASKEKVPVRIGIQLTAIGTLQLWLSAEKSSHRWTLEFQLRTASGQEDSLALIAQARQDETFDASILEIPKEQIRALFSGALKPNKIMDQLEKCLERPKNEWAPSILRGLWEEVCTQAPKRKSNQDLEARWWNLAGFLLRPGVGYPLDDFRLKELWKVILGDLKANQPMETQIQSWICYRRIAAGLSKGQQMQLANELFPQLLQKKSGKIEIRNKSELYQYQERIRTLAALEFLDVSFKVRLGNLILERMRKDFPTSAELWALARLGARHLLYGSIGHVIPPESITQWVEAILKMDGVESEQKMFVLGQLGRKTDQRELNLPESLLDRILHHFTDRDLISSLLFEQESLSQSQQEKIYGDSLPLGISIEK